MIIAELSANHMGSIRRAKSLIKAAAEAGADAVKLQTYEPEDMTLDVDAPGFVLDKAPWDGERLFDLYYRAQTPRHWYKALAEHARSLGLMCFSSPFSVDAVKFLEGFHPPFYKIASCEITHVELIAAAAATSKPLIISTGCATEADILAALSIPTVDRKAVTLMHCVASYPTRPEQANLGCIAQLRERWGCNVGLSDHSLSIYTPVAATALGATMIEKHLTLKRSDGGPDAAFSLEPDEFAAMAAAVRETRLALQPCTTASDMVGLKRSLYVVQDIKAGDVITRDNVRAIRPSGGMLPSSLPILLGMKARKDALKGTPMQMEVVQ